MHIRLKRAGIILMVVALVMSFSVQPISADEGGYSKTIHKGKYYFKYDYGNQQLLISKKKRSGFKAVPVRDSNYVTNGKIVVYLYESGDKYTIKRYTIASKKTKVEKKLPKNGYWSTQGVGGKYIWLSNGKHLYSYDILKKKLKLKKKKCSLNHLKNQYYIGYLGKETIYAKPTDDYGNITYLYTQKANIYKITKNGKTKVVKSLGAIGSTSVEEYDVSDYGKVGKMYYSTAGLHKLYRINSNGKGRELIATFSGIIANIYDDHCFVYDDGQWYYYTYNTETMRETDGNG